MSNWAAAVLIALGLLVLLLGDPTLEDRLKRTEPELQAELDERGTHIDPAELLSLLHNNQVRLAVLDTRPDAEFNLFHISDSRRVAPRPGRDTWTRDLPATAVKVVVGSDEHSEEETWKRLRALGLTNVYLLEGGIDAWVGAYHEGAPFDAALGERHAAARPDAERVSERQFEKKVKVAVASKSAGGGCG